MTNYPFKVGEIYPLRGGGTAKIIAVGEDLSSGESIVGIVEGKHVYCWFASGKFYPCEQSSSDLLPPEPERVSRWMNVYDFPFTSHLYATRADADKDAELITAIKRRTHVLELIYEGGFFVDVIKHKVGE